MIMKINKLHCNICQSNKISLLYKSVRSWDIQGKYNYYRCGNCKVIFLYPMPTIGTLNKYYAHESYWGVDNKIQNQKDRIKEAEKSYGYIYNLLDLNVKHSILDIGTGSSLFLHKLKIQGWEVMGTDISQRMREFSKIHFGIKVLTPQSLHKTSFKKKFDYIIMNNVIEHLRDPIKEISVISLLLKKSGVLIISTPNSNSLGHILFKSKWYHLDIGRHLYVFNDINLKEIYHTAGFKVERVLHGYQIHNIAGIFESIRHIYKNKYSRKNVKVVSKNEKWQEKNVLKSIFVSFIYLFSLIISKLGKVLGRGEIITIYAKRN